MKRILLVLLVFGCAVVSTAGNKVLLIGDSITKGDGSSDGFGFMKTLADSLDALNYELSYVGSSGWSPYKGHFWAGALIDYFYPASLPGGTGDFDVTFDMDVYRPNIAVIHLGTNDAWGEYNEPAPFRDPDTGELTTTMSGKLAHLIAYLCEWAVGAKGSHLKTIFVCQIIPARGLDFYRTGKVEAYNAEIAAFVDEANLGLIPGVPAGIMKLVDQYSTFNMSTMLTDDDTHPNDLGYYNMALQFIDRFKSLPFYLIHESEPNALGTAGGMLEEPLRVKATDYYGNGTHTVGVEFLVTAGDASLLTSSAVTDSGGIAFTEIQLGNVGYSAISATASGLVDSTVMFNVEASLLARISGSVIYHLSGVAVRDVMLRRSQTGTMVDTTDVSGLFSFRSVSLGENASLIPEKQAGTDVDISIFSIEDAALIAEYVVGRPSLAGSLTPRIADADGDQAISIRDAALIARASSGLPNPAGSIVGNWIFSPDSAAINPVAGDQRGLIFTAAVVGDLHGSWSAPAQSANAGTEIKISENDQVKTGKIEIDR